MRRSYRSNGEGFLKMILGIGVGWLALIVLCLIGWVMNIVHLFHMASVMTGEGAVRIAGIFLVPLGGIMGWFF